MVVVVVVIMMLANYRGSMANSKTRNESSVKQVQRWHQLTWKQYLQGDELFPRLLRHCTERIQFFCGNMAVLRNARQ